MYKRQVPSYRLHLKDAVDDSVESGLCIERSADTAKTWINTRGGATNFNNQNHAGSAGLSYKWFADESQKMVLDTSGDLEIGGSKLTFGYNDQYLQVGTGTIALKNSSNAVLWSSANQLSTSGGTLSGTLTIGGTIAATSDMILDAAGGLVLDCGSGEAISFKLAGSRHSIIEGTSWGIGTSSPNTSTSLHVAGAKTYPLRVTASNTDYFFANNILYANSGSGFTLLNQSSFLALGANDAEVMRLTGGNLGIANEVPTSKLDVSGEIKTHSTTDKISNGAMASTSSWTMYNLSLIHISEPRD